MEQVDLTTPQTQSPATNYKINKILLGWLDKAIRIELVADNGETLEASYDGDEAHNLMVALNKMDLSTNSLHKRIMTKLINDGYLSGTITGTPD